MKLRSEPSRSSGFATAIAAVALWAFLVCVPTASADYVVLRSGATLHVTSYQRIGDQLILTVQGGTVQIAASDLASIEPEEIFPEQPAASSTAPFSNLIRAAAEQNGVDEKLITRVIAAESNFNPRAISHKQALGLMQLLPETAERYAVSNVFDPAQNIDAGTHYLKDLLARYDGNLILALAAYNAGPDMVDRYHGVPPFPETQNYVKEITSKLAVAAATIPKN
jgi:soluble lytic murein transglycosylase-like protein